MTSSKILYNPLKSSALLCTPQKKLLWQDITREQCLYINAMAEKIATMTFLYCF